MCLSIAYYEILSSRDSPSWANSVQTRLAICTNPYQTDRLSFFVTRASINFIAGVKRFSKCRQIHALRPLRILPPPPTRPVCAGLSPTCPACLPHTPCRSTSPPLANCFPPSPSKLSPAYQFRCPTTQQGVGGGRRQLDPPRPVGAASAAPARPGCSQADRCSERYLLGTCSGARNG